MTDIAALYLQSGMGAQLQQTVQSAQDNISFVYDSYKKPKYKPTEIKVADPERYILYPKAAKPLVKAANTPQELQAATIASNQKHLLSFISASRKKWEKSFIPQRIYQNATKQLYYMDHPNDAISVAWDLETLTLTGKNGEKLKHVLEYSFDYGVGKNRKLKDGLQASGLIGVTDQNMIDALNNILHKVENGETLNSEEDLAYKFISRYGDAGTQIEKGANGHFYVKALTTKQEAEFKTANNLAKGIKKLTDVGAEQIKVDARNIEALNFIDNLNYMASKEVNLVSSYNGNVFDIGYGHDYVTSNPDLKKYMENRLGKNKSFARPVMAKTSDQYEITKYVNQATRSRYLKKIYPSGIGIADSQESLRQENIARALGLDQLTAHAANADTAVTRHLATDPNSPTRMLLENIVETYRSYRDQNRTYSVNPNDFEWTGSLIQMGQPGSMDSLKFGNDAFGYITLANGDQVYSNGMILDKTGNKVYSQEQYIPGLWKKDLTYQINGLEVVDPDQYAGVLIDDVTRLKGEKLVHITMSPYMDERLRPYEALNTTSDVFIRESEYESWMSKNTLVRTHTKSNKDTVTIRATQHMNDYLGVSGDTTYPDTMSFYADFNYKVARDKGERSLNKLSKTTNEQILEYKHILETGKFANPKQKVKQLFNAIYNDVNDPKQDFARLKSIVGSDTNAQEDAIKMAKGFVIKDKFNTDYLRNVSVVAENLQTGSVFEQVHNMVMSQIKAEGLKLNSFEESDIYHNAMDAVLSHLRSNIAPEHLGQKTKVTAADSRFYINMDQYVWTKHAGKFIDKSQPTYLGLDLESIDISKGAIFNLEGLSEGQKAFNRRRKEAILNVLAGIGESDFGLQEIEFGQGKNKKVITVRDYIEGRFKSKNRPINKERTEDVLGDFLGILRRIRSSKGGNKLGRKPLDYNETMGSFVMEAHEITGDIADQLVSVAKKSIQSTVANNGVKKNEAIRKKVFQALSAGVNQDFLKAENLIKMGYSQEMADLTSYLLKQDMGALHFYSNFLVDSIEKCGGQVAVGKGNQIYASFGHNQRLEDISQRLLHLSTNNAGVISYRTGAKDSAWISQAQFVYTPHTTQQVELHSALQHAMSKYGAKGRSAYARMEKSIADGEDRVKAIMSVLSSIHKDIRHSPLSGTSPALDIKNQGVASIMPLLWQQGLEERIPEWEKTYKDNSNIIERINKVKGYMQAVKNGKDQAKALSPDVRNAFYELFIGGERIIDLPDGISQYTGAKQSKENMTVAITPFQVQEFGAIENPGKGISQSGLNSTYYVVGQNENTSDLIPAYRRNLDVIEAPRITNQLGQNVRTFKDKSGIILTDELQVKTVETSTKHKEDILKALIVHNDGTQINQQMFASASDQIRQVHEWYMQGAQEMWRSRNARIAAKRINVTEGGGAISGYLADQYRNFWGSEVINLNGNDIDFGTEIANQKFRDATAFTFENGKFKYGNGLYRNYNEPVAAFRERYKNRIAETPAKGPSYVNVRYTTQEGKGILTAEQVQKAVEEKLGRKASDINEFTNTADSIFNRAIVATSLFEGSGYSKKMTRNEKNISGTLNLALGSLFNDKQMLSEALSSQEIMANPVMRETMIREVLGQAPFDTIEKTLGTDWKGSRALGAEAFDALATMDFSHPLFSGAKSTEFKEAITNTFKKYKFDEKDIPKAWADILYGFRYATSLAVSDVTGGGQFFSKNARASLKHEDVEQLVDRTVGYIQNLLNKTSNAPKDALANLEASVEIFNRLKVIRDVSQNDLPVDIKIAKNGSMIVNVRPENLGIDTSIIYDEKELEKALTGTAIKGTTVQDLKNALSEDFLEPIYAGLRTIKDDANANKAYRQGPREFSAYSSRIWTENIADDVLKGLEDDWGLNDKFVSKYINAADIRHKAVTQSFIGGDTVVDSLMRDVVAAGYGFNEYSSAKDGTTVRAGKRYKKKIDKKDAYRAEKTDDIIKEWKKITGHPDAYVSQQYADDAYDVASTKAAAEFNKSVGQFGNIQNKITNLQTDWGKTTVDKNFFQVRNINTLESFTGAGINAMANDPTSALRKNTIWNMTDSSIGLTEAVLGDNAYVAVAGTSTHDLKELDELISMNSPQRYLNGIGRLREEVEAQYKINPNSQAYEDAVNKYIEGIKNLKQSIDVEAAGHKGTKAYNLTHVYTPSAASLKANITDTVVADPNSIDFNSTIGNKKFQGRTLKEWREKGRNVNYAIINESQLAQIGYDDDYFKKIGVSKKQWLQKARTEGVEAMVHRYPTGYWGSHMAVQLYVDTEGTGGIIKTDEITAAFMKADADGDRAYFTMHGITRKDGMFMDLNSLKLTKKKNKNPSLEERAEDLRRAHAHMMNAQIYAYNKIIKAGEDKQKTIIDPYEELIKKRRTDLSGTKIDPNGIKVLSKEEKRIAADEFFGVKNELEAALQKSKKSISAEDLPLFERGLKDLAAAKNGEEAYSVFSKIIQNNHNINRSVYENLGNSKDTVNKIYRKMASTMDADIILLQSIMRGSAGVVDNPFMVADLLRRQGLEMQYKNGKRLISAEDSFVIQQVREQVQEAFLTAKKADRESVEAIGKSAKMNTLYNNLIRGKSTQAEEKELVDIMLTYGRDANDRYNPEGLFKNFLNAEGKIDNRKMIERFVEINKTLPQIIKDNAEQADGSVKRMMENIYTLLNTANARNEGVKLLGQDPGKIIEAIGATSGYIKQEDVQSVINATKTAAQIKQKAAKNLITPYAEQVIKNTKSAWNKNVLLLAGATMLTGFIGGNPATPSGQEARQQAPVQAVPKDQMPKQITLADPGMSTAKRKQPGYIININAQTQRDKEYASQVIAQSVTQNFQDTNINVSMNVNQQPGNITGNQIKDYLMSVFN